MRRFFTEVAWDARMFFGSKRVGPNGPAAWFRFRVLEPIRGYRDGFRRREDDNERDLRT